MGQAVNELSNMQQWMLSHNPRREGPSEESNERLLSGGRHKGVRVFPTKVLILSWGPPLQY